MLVVMVREPRMVPSMRTMGPVSRACCRAHVVARLGHHMPAAQIGAAPEPIQVVVQPV